MSVVYALRNGEVKITDTILEGVPINLIRGVMITPNVELVIEESFDNFQSARLRAEKLGGEILSVRHQQTLRSCWPKIKETCQRLKDLMGENYRYHEVDVIPGTEKMYWCSEYCDEDIRIFKQPHRHYTMCIESSTTSLLPDIMYATTRVLIRHYVRH